MSIEFEKKLTTELSNLGIYAQHNYLVPGTKLTIDFYIKAPIRAVIEVNSYKSNNLSSRKKQEQLADIFKKFSKSIIIFNIILGSSKQSVRQDSLLPFTSIFYIDVPDQKENPEQFCANKIRGIFVNKSIQLKTNELEMRMQEKHQIFSSISNINKNEEICGVKEEHLKEKIKFSSHKLSELKKLYQETENPYKNKLKSEIDHLNHTLSSTSMELEDIEKKNQYLAKQDEVLRNNQEKNSLEIKSIQGQLSDLFKDEANAEVAIEILKRSKDLKEEREQKDIQPGLKYSIKSSEHINADNIIISQNSLSKDQVKNLEDTKFSNNSSFKIIKVYEVQGQDFKDYFPHLKKWYKPMQILQTDQGWFVDSTIKEHGASKWEKGDYDNCKVSYSLGGKFKPLWLQKDNVFTREPLNEGMFGDVLSTFQSFLSPKQYQVLVKEVVGFEEEYNSKHFTTAVLRIGRTLEYVIYTLVTSWGVSINNSSNSRIDKLNNGFEKVCKQLVYYYSPDKDKEKQKETLAEAFDQLTTLINKTQRELDNVDEIIETDIKINIDALLRSVKTKYAENKETREAINILNESKLIKLTLEKRNSAAHADHSGLKKDFTEEDVKIMAKDLEIILFYLSNIHETIMAIEVEK